MTIKEKCLNLWNKSAPGIKQSAYMEQFYLYLTVSKPTDRLYLSYRMMDAAGIITVRPILLKGFNAFFQN